MKDFFGWLIGVVVFTLVIWVIISATGGAPCPSGQNNSAGWASGC